MNARAFVTSQLGGIDGALRAVVHDVRGVQLAWPWVLLLWVLLAGAAVFLFKNGQRPARLLFARADLARAAGVGRNVLWARAALTAGVVASALVVVALAHPEVLGEPDPATTEGIDLVVALDVSGSMRAADFRPRDRLTVAKDVINDTVLQRPRDRTGLVVFAGEAFTQAPLTHDKALLRQILSGVRTGVIADGTAIGDGLAVSLNRLKQSKASTRAIILLSDGANTAGTLAPDSATDLAVDLGVKVFTILVGRGGRVPFPDGTDLFGAPHFQNVEIPTDPELMKRIATRTGGAFYLATDKDALSTSFQQILDKLDRSLLEGALPLRRKLPLAPLVLVPAALLWLFALAVSMLRGSTVP